MENHIKAIACEVAGPNGDTLVAQPVFLIDPCQNGSSPLRTATLVSSTTGDAAAFLAILQSRFATFDKAPTGSFTSNPIFDLNNYGYHFVTAANTAQTAAFDTKGMKSMAVVMVASGGTASVVIHGSMDNFGTQDVTVDSIAAALTVTKQYDDTHLATTLAINPLLFRFIKVIVSSAGVGNTTTLDIAVK
jgi:hypothetical protein